MVVSQPLASTIATARQGEQLGERGVLSDNQRLRIWLGPRSWRPRRRLTEEFAASSGLRFSAVCFLSNRKARDHSQLAACGDESQPPANTLSTSLPLKR